MEGPHTITLTIPDYPEQTLTRDVTSETTVVSLTLDVGLLTVTVDPGLAPPGGTAFLDGNKLGSVPFVRRIVPAGDHDLVVRWPDTGNVYRRQITVPKMPNVLVVPPVAPPSE